MLPSFPSLNDAELTLLHGCYPHSIFPSYITVRQVLKIGDCHVTAHCWFLPKQPVYSPAHCGRPHYLVFRVLEEWLWRRRCDFRYVKCADLKVYSAFRGICGL
jgi:hypothetical protein